MKIIKIIILSIQNLKNFIKQKTLLFFIILFGLSVSVVAILFYTGYFLNNFEGATNTNDATIKIKITDSSVSAKDIVNRLENNHEIKPNRIMAYENDPDDINSKTDVENMKIPIIGDKYFINLPENLLDSGNYFNNENDDAALITSSALKYLKMEKAIGQTVELDKTKYKIIGLVSPFYYLPYSDKCIIISLNKFLSDYTATYLHFEYEKTITAIQSKKLNEILSEMHGIEIIQLPSKSNPLNSSLFLSALFQILLIFFISFINILSLSYYWIKSNHRNYCVYSLCGATKKTITAIIMINNLIISLLGIFIGTIFFKFISPFLLNFHIIAEFTLKRYSSILIILLLLSIVLAVVMSIKYNRNQKIYKISGE